VFLLCHSNRLFNQKKTAPKDCFKNSIYSFNSTTTTAAETAIGSTYNTRTLFCNAIKYNTSLQELILYVSNSIIHKEHSKLMIENEFLDELAEVFEADITRIKRLVIQNHFPPVINAKDYSITKFMIKANGDYNGWRSNNQLRYELIQSKQFKPIKSRTQTTNCCYRKALVRRKLQIVRTRNDSRVCGIYFKSPA
jgi:hypothetical protein